MSFLTEDRPQLERRLEFLKAEIREIESWLSRGLTPSLRTQLSADAFKLRLQVHDLETELAKKLPPIVQAVRLPRPGAPWRN